MYPYAQECLYKQFQTQQKYFHINALGGITDNSVGAIGNN